MKKQTKTDVWSILAGILFVGLLAGEGLMIYRIVRLDLIPEKYLGYAAGAAGILVLLTILTGIFLFPREKNRKKTGFLVLRVIAFLLALVMGAGSFLTFGVLQKLDETFSQISSTEVIRARIHVYVRQDDSARELTDASGYVFGVTPSYDGENTEKTLAEMEALLGIPVQTRSYDNVLAMITGLYAGECQAVVLNSAYVGILESVEGFGDFSERNRTIFSHDIKEIVEVTQPAETEPVEVTREAVETTEPVDPLEVPFVVYLSGSDSRNTYLTEQNNSDVNILAAINPKTRQILLVNTPRDYFVPNPAGDGALDKLTHCGVYGVECSMQALSEFYGQPIAYNAKINFKGFKTLIDAVGGITIYSEHGDGVLLHQGENHMNGEEALWFARNRKSYGGGDNTRGRHQMQVIEAVVGKLTSGTTLISNYAGIMNSLQGLFATSMPMSTITEYIKMQLDDMRPWQVYSYAVTGTGASRITYSIPGLYAYVMLPDEKDVAFASDLIGRVLDGQALTQADLIQN